MVKKEGPSKIPAALVLGLGIGLIVTIIGALITAWLIQAQVIEEDVTGFAAMVIILLSAVAAAAVAAGKGASMHLVMCLGGGGIYFLGLLCNAAILFDGVRAGVIPSACAALGGSMLVYLLGMKGGRRKKYKIPRSRF